MPVQQYILCTAKTAQCSVRIIGALEYLIQTYNSNLEWTLSSTQHLVQFRKFKNDPKLAKTQGQNHQLIFMKNIYGIFK
jgi:hypothetical protein